jgi:hypothetical protein
MPASEAMIGYGSTFAVETAAASGVFTPLSEVTDITPPSESVDVIDVTHMGSADSTREFIQGLMDPGEVTIDMNWVPSSATDAFILAWRSSRETRAAKITFPNGVIWTFSALPTGRSFDLPVGEIQTGSLTAKVTGSKVKT